MGESKPFINIGPGDIIRDELEARGWSQETFAEILGISNPHVNKMINGNLWQAKRIVRTEYINAHNQAAFQRYQDYGFTHYGISVEECEPECDICPPEIGKVYKFGDGPVPPLHPNCRCSIFPIKHIDSKI